MLHIGKHIVKSPTLMGILNVTPDSFSDGGVFYDSPKAIDHALKMVEEGADIIDIGGESSRPGAEAVTKENEIERILPVIEGIRRKSDIPLSIDTTKSDVAKVALKAGANMINDISAGRFDPPILEVAASAGVPICMMHMKGDPKTMQQNPLYEDLMGEIKSFLGEAINRAKKAGIKPQDIIIDPGIGFGKTAEDNVNILKELSSLKSLNHTILIGPSRKSFIGKMLGLNVDDRLEATLATLSFAYQNGASIFRVHDVGPAKKYLSMTKILRP